MRNLIVCFFMIFATQSVSAQFSPPDLCDIIPSLPQCDDNDDGEVANCSVVQLETDGCFEITCPDGSSAVLCDGEDGQKGVDGEDGGSCHVEEVEGGVRIFCDDGTESFVNHGDSCTVVEEDSCTTVIECEDGSVTTVTNGVSCFDLNGNCKPDLCDPFALEVFETCEDFFDYCSNPREDYEGGLPLDCSFTEDVNSDGVVDSLDCIGPTGGAGGTGAPGEDGFNCFDLNMNHLADPEEDVNEDGVIDVMDCVGPVGDSGVDADPCTVVDNLDGTVTVICPDGSEVVLGDPVEVVSEFLLEEESNSTLCGNFGGALFVLGFPMLGLYCARRKLW